MAIMVALDFPLQDVKRAGFLELLGGALPDTRAFDGCLKVETFAEADGKSVLLKRLAFNLIHILPRRRSSNIRQE